MKKIISMFLSVVLVVALSIPAFALDGTDDYYDDEWTTDDYYDYYDYDAEIDAWIANWALENPELAADILADDPPLWELWGYDSIEDFMLDYDLETKADYYDYVLRWYAEDYYYDYLWEQEMAESIKNTRLSMGGTESGLGVLFNESYISFPDAQPEVISGLTMIPLRAYVEALGGEVVYDTATGELAVVINGVEMNMSTASSTLEAVVDGESATIELGCTPYIKDGVTYVPVRAISELAGYDVYWDSVYDTVVVIDSAALISEIDANYSVINKLFTMNNLDPTKTYKTVGDILVSYTELNSLDGDSTIDVAMNIKTIQNGMNGEMSVTVDARELIGMLVETDDYMLPDETLALLESISELSMDVILNMDEQCMYVKSNIFAALDMGVDENTWIMFGSDYIGEFVASYEDLLSSDLYSTLTSGGNLTLGAYLYTMTAEMYGSDSVFIYGDVCSTAEEIAFLNDTMFKRNGNAYTLNISLDNYDAFMTALYGEGYDSYYAEDFVDSYKEFDVTLKITDVSGNITVSGDFDIRENPDYAYVDTRYSGTFSMTSRSLDMDVEIHEKNTDIIDISLNYATYETSDTVATAPPSGSAVIDYDELMSTLYDQTDSDLTL